MENTAKCQMSGKDGECEWVHAQQVQFRFQNCVAVRRRRWSRLEVANKKPAWKFKSKAIGSVNCVK